MLELKEIKTFLRIDGDEDDRLLVSLSLTARELVEETLRQRLDEFETIPETVRQAMLIVIATLYEERQVAKTGKDSVGMTNILELVRRMLFAYRKETF
ncbi:MAG TPA: head-tail connector protein [Clostridia bacterium]